LWAGTPLLILVYLFTPLYIVQFIVLFLLFLLLGSKLYSEYLRRNIRLRRRDHELREFRHQWIDVEIVVENHGRLPGFLCALSDSPGMMPVFKNNKLLRTMGAHSRAAIHWQGYCSERGIFTLGPAVLNASDPLFLFPFSIKEAKGTTLFVYPSMGLIAVNAPGGVPPGSLLTTNRLFEDPTRKRSLREYQNGDETRRINWKATSRVGRMMVNEYEATRFFPLMIFLNLDPYAYPLIKRELHLERSIEAATALCLMASRERQELGIILYTPDTNGGISVIAPGAFTLIPILERLAGFKRSAAENESGTISTDLSGGAKAMLDQGKYLPYGTRFIYTGPNLKDEEYMALNALKRYQLSLEYLVIDEHSLPSSVLGNSRRYQMKEGGYEII
jgi:uncharacterized protein (DUF58 family)